jgi:undecaprenyl-diphosphatase
VRTTVRIGSPLAVVTVALVALAALTLVRETPAVVDLDRRLERHRAAWPGWAHEVWLWLDRLGGHWWLPLLVAAAVLVTWWRGDREGALVLVGASAGVDAVLHLLKLAVDTDRVGEGTTLPDEASFPSGHATTALTAYVAIAAVATRGRSWPLRTTAVAAAAVVGAAVGTGRWLDGGRAATDVVGGLLLGVAWLGATAAVVVAIRTRRA